MNDSHETNRTASLHAEAKKHLPLGVADSYRFWEDESVFLDSMRGASITDCDGVEYVDFRLAYGPIILGYRDPRVDSAVIETLQTVGSMSGFSSPLDAEVVSLVKRLCPQIEKMRFANSGTEAVMGAVRTARGFTGRDRIVVVEGGFHGLYEEMMWRVDVEAWDPDSGEEPEVIPFGAGIPEITGNLVDFVELNDLDGLKALFEAKGDQIAAIVIEPIMGNCGSIASTQAYMQALRDTCDAHGALLILDEVKTGFRVARGGAQELYGIHADLTTYAKAMGNGYPVAAFGGRADVMDGIKFGRDGVTHGGTYTANMIGLSAAKASLTVLAETDAQETIDRVGAQIRDALGRVFTKHGIEHTFAGPASMFGVHFGPEVPQSYRDWKRTDAPLYTAFCKQLIQRGIMLEPDSREPWFICEAHAKVDLAWLESVADEAMAAAIAAEGK